jgi:hypothetical protein
MTYYLAVTGEGIGKNAADGMTIVRALIDRGFWTFPDAPSVRALEPGDRFAIYVTKGGGVAGFVGVASLCTTARRSKLLLRR